MPTHAIDPLVVHQSRPHTQPGTKRPGSLLRTVFTTPLLSLYLGFNREVYEEVKDVFYSAVTFTISVSRDGVMLCGRRILAPKSPDGSDLYFSNRGTDRFIRDFAWTAARNYTVVITVESGLNQRWVHGIGNIINDWDEEVEMYDIRDLVGVVVSGVLAKARLLCSLQVHVNLKKFYWDPDIVLSITKLLVGPFERLRCVRKPRLMRAFCGDALAELYAQRHRPYNDKRNRCITPTPPDLQPTISSGMPAFDSYAAYWNRQLAPEAPSKILSKSPMTHLFMEFRAFQNCLLNIIPRVIESHSRGYLHRARVAREHENIAAFRAVKAELVQHWHDYLAQQELQRAEVNTFLLRMTNADVYPNEESTSVTTRLGSAAPLYRHTHLSRSAFIC
ncbi:hypothetical protein M3J09_003279 [Ascochyta lentis]